MPSLFQHPLRRLLLVLLAVVTALPFGTAAVHAAPAPMKAYVTGSDTDVLVRIGSGELAVEDGFLVIRDNAGQLVDAYRLSYIAPDNRTYPIDATIDGRTATLVPSVDAARATRTPADVLKSTARKNAAYPNATIPNATSPSTSSRTTSATPTCDAATKTQRQQQAVSLLSGEMAMASSLGATIGGAIGLIIGILGGGVLALISVPLGSLIGVGIGVGIVALTGGFSRYFKVMNGKDC